MNNTDSIKDDCTCCKHYLLCRKPSHLELILCEDFVTIFPNDEVEDNVVVDAPTAEESPIKFYICSGVGEFCTGCPHAVKHTFNNGGGVGVQCTSGSCADSAFADPCADCTCVEV